MGKTNCQKTYSVVPNCPVRAVKKRDDAEWEQMPYLKAIKRLAPIGEPMEDGSRCLSNLPS
jgi:hypothetical protein